VNIIATASRFIGNREFLGFPGNAPSRDQSAGNMVELLEAFIQLKRSTTLL
jgi:hypothetical protein